MIEVRRLQLHEVEADAVLRGVGADGDAITPAGRRLETAAGPAMTDRLRDAGELPVGSALLTSAGELPCDFVIHLVLQAPDEAVSSAGVRRALENALRRAVDWGLETVALPPLGTGAGNLDAEEAAGIVFDVLGKHMSGGEPPTRFIVVVEDEYEEEVFGRRLSARPDDRGG